jgi:DNA-binding transcriptional LysR family regulator
MDTPRWGYNIEMSGARIGGIDLNLLTPLHALLTEKNVSYAANKVQMSQPAMSGALSRLREYFDDELLVRKGKGYELTGFSESLLPEVIEALESISTVFSSKNYFIPDTTDRTFKILVSDYAMSVIVVPLLGEISRLAPDVRVHFEPIPNNAEDFESLLLLTDILIGADGYDIPGEKELYFSDNFVAILRNDNDLVPNGKLDLDVLKSLPHLSTHFGNSKNPATLAFERAIGHPITGHKNTGLLQLPFAVAESDLVAFVPRKLAIQSAGYLPLRIEELPFEGADLVEYLHWHPSRTKNASSKWLRDLLKLALTKI